MRHLLLAQPSQPTYDMDVCSLSMQMACAIGQLPGIQMPLVLGHAVYVWTKKSSIFKNQHFSLSWQVQPFACCSIVLSGKKCIEHWVIFTFCLLFNPKIPTKLWKYLIWQECLNVILFFCANTKHSGKGMPSHYMCRQSNQTCSRLQWTLNCLTASTWKVNKCLSC